MSEWVSEWVSDSLTLDKKITVEHQRKEESNIVLRTRVLWEEEAQQALFENRLLVFLPPTPTHLIPFLSLTSFWEIKSPRMLRDP